MASPPAVTLPLLPRAISLGRAERRGHARRHDSFDLQPGDVLSWEAGPAGGDRAGRGCAELRRKRGICVFKSDSVNTVRSVVEAATGKISSNEYDAINEGNAVGLPA